ncbi:MAG: gamma-glutamylcyclotransferase [Actinobacteria bacterium]|nr:MAG: gamma-glutamylcyclotransferase [Actinomycetota bacterium]
MLYFAYGANMDPHHMQRRVPDARSVSPARLDGFRLAFNVYSTEWEGGAANIELDEGEHVWGVLWEVPEHQAGGLDAFQGHPTFFRREDVVANGPDGPVVAWTYRVAHQEGSYVRPTDEYLRLLHSAVRLHGLPPEALDIVDRAARPPKPSIST